ncbi:MAG: superoxide dismutase family protein [Nitrospira sp.]|nr:superoxide dismutase family protein [Nitrospira sp.]MDH4327212.1 superoxide dismutase family protein [Nitrospira sp.]
MTVDMMAANRIKEVGMNAFSMIGAGVAVGLILSGCTSYHTGKLAAPLNAKAVITGPGITGEAYLYEKYEGRVRIKLTVQGSPESKLTPGLHGIHIHEVGSCESFAAAQGHYDGNIDANVNSDASVNPGLGNHPYHLGDLQNLYVDERRKGSLYTITSRVTLSDGLNTLFDKNGSAFIIHELQDKYLPDPPTKDAPGGPRIACGVIVKQ